MLMLRQINKAIKLSIILKYYCGIIYYYLRQIKQNINVYNELVT